MSFGKISGGGMGVRVRAADCVTDCWGDAPVLQPLATLLLYSSQGRYFRAVFGRRFSLVG